MASISLFHTCLLISIRVYYDIMPRKLLIYNDIFQYYFGSYPACSHGRDFFKGARNPLIYKGEGEKVYSIQVVL